MLAYHHDKKTPIHLLIAGLTTRDYHYARGTLSTQVLLSITLLSRPREPVPDAGLPSRLRVICISMKLSDLNQKQVFLRNTHVFQTIKTRTPTTVTTGSSELI